MQRLFCIVPAYRAADTVVDVVASALVHADEVIVVDDGCPQHSGDRVRAAYAGNASVLVIDRERNGGVGAAVKTGIGAALERGADFIVKIDADGQMDSSFIATIRELFAEDPALVCIKGNRFFDSSILQEMPKRRLFGNAGLSLLAKFASGYWNIADPANGYLAFNTKLLRLLPWQSFADSYFFETSVLCELGLKQVPILELEMPTIYTSAPSSLSIPRVALDFPMRLLRLTLRRIFLQYFVFDVNLGSVYIVFGTLLLLFGSVFGGYQWIDSIVTGIARSTGTVMVAVLPFLMGFQLILNALMYDVQFAQRTSHELLLNVYRRFPKPPRTGDG
jgi:dolichol-phosphate mannosyltransferase